MDEKCACHINGYKLKDAEARQKATAAGQTANTAMEKAMEAATKITAVETTANRAKNTAERAEVTAKGAFNTATDAANTAAAAANTAAAAETAAKQAEIVAENAASNVVAALDTAAAALPRRGGTMAGDLDMGQNNIRNAEQVMSKRVLSNVIDVEFKQNAGTTAPMLYRVGGVGDNVMTVHAYKKNLLTGEYNTNAPMDVIVRGVALPEKSNDAVNKKYVDDTFAALREEFAALREEFAALREEFAGSVGGVSMFGSTASGILPEVHRGTANSEFSLNFESGAVGALSE